MQRRLFIKEVIGGAVALHPVGSALRGPAVPLHNAVTSGLRAPVFVYNNWSSYDELSDNIPLTEELALRELAEVVRLKKAGVRFDYYMMDAFWFDKNGGYRVWHKEHWPNGPDRWLSECQANGILPGMWFSTNFIGTGGSAFLNVIPEWKDSVATDPKITCLFEGGYLDHLAGSLQIWYDRGVRMFKFDFAYFEAATESVKKTELPARIEEMNKLALMNMLKSFRAKNSDVVITGYNGFGGDMENTFTPFRKTVDARWLEVFDTIYCGDPRFSDVPMLNIWRSQDNYSDHMSRQFEFNGVPIRRIDNCAFMIGKTGTCYSRALQAWKGMLILELARGGWMNVYHGNLELLSDADAHWFGKVQKLFHRLQKYSICSFTGDIPGAGRPYAFKMEAADGIVITYVNPSQSVEEVELPANDSEVFSVLYADGGFRPHVNRNRLTIGCEQMVVLGSGEYTRPVYSLGVDNTIRIPQGCIPLETVFNEKEKNRVAAVVNPPAGKFIRVLFQQFDTTGFPRRSWGGAPPNGKKMSDLLTIKVTQGGNAVPMQLNYDKMIWSGLSWGAAEIDPKHILPGTALQIECASTESEPLVLKARVYAINY